VQFLPVSGYSGSPLTRQGHNAARPVEQPGKLPRGGFELSSNLQGTTARSLVLNTFFIHGGGGMLSRIQIRFCFLFLSLS
jgi:hypothetical protein